MERSRNTEPLLPHWDLAAAAGPTPRYAIDAARRAALEKAAAEAIADAVGVTPSFVTPPELPFLAIGSRDQTAALGAVTAEIALAVATAHVPPSPFQADPYDGTAFEVAIALREAGHEPTWLSLGLPGDPLPPRVLAARLRELGRFAYELRRATGLEPEGIALIGGVRPPRLSWQRASEEGRLVAAWRDAARAMAKVSAGFGLPWRRLLVDLGSPADSLSVLLVTRATHAGEGLEPTLACDAPASALAHVRGALDERADLPKLRLCSALDPPCARLPRVRLAKEPLPRTIALRIARRVTGLE